MNEENPIKHEGTRVVTTLSINFKMLKGSLLHNRQLDLGEIQTHTSLYCCPSYLQV